MGDTTQRPVSPGDTILLYDYSENEVYGPMRAITGCRKNIVPNAWRGNYPHQVRVAWDTLYRISSSKFPRIENKETLSEAEFQAIVNLLQKDGQPLLMPEWGSQTAAFADDVVVKPDADQISTAEKKLKSQLDTEPPDTEPVDYHTVDQLARTEAFRRVVREVYNERCAVCGAHRETPDGHPEVEAAHIKPKAEGGPDDIRNGIALCKLHHWAFDNGWFSITSNHHIDVTDAPTRAGFDEFINFDGRQLRLPDDSRMHPSPKYLKYS